MKKELLRISGGEIRTPAGESVRDIHLLLREGECISLVGNESSGRGQLARLFAGEGSLLRGTLWVRGRAMQEYSRTAMETQKIYYLNTHQPFMNCLNLAENFFLMRHSRMNKTVLNQHAIELLTQQVLEEYGLKYRADCDVRTLSQLDRLLLGIVKAADQGASIIVLDEVTRGLTLPQIRQLLALLCRLKEQGIGLIISDNWCNWFEETADCLVLLQDGQIIRKLYGMEEFVQQETLLHYTPTRKVDAKVRSLQEGEHRQKVTLLLEYRDIEFSIDCWEGQSVLLHSFDHQVLEGCWESLTLEHSRCRIRFADETVDFAGPAALLRRRIVFWDADRPETLLQENLTPEENILLPSMPRISPQGLWQKNGRRILTDESFWGQNMLREEGQKPLSKLSVLCSRWKLFHPRVLLMHNAFSASDRDGRAALLRYVNELCERNTTVILLEAADEFLRGYTDKDVAL